MDIRGKMNPVVQWRYCKAAYGNHTYRSSPTIPASLSSFRISDDVRRHLAPPLGTHYIRAIHDLDTVTIALANDNLASAMHKSSVRAPYELEIRTAPFSGALFAGGPRCKYTDPDNTLCVSAFVNTVFPDQGFVGPYPNPFKPLRDGSIRFPLSLLQSVPPRQTRTFTPQAWVL
jgi:hypothetical protein